MISRRVFLAFGRTKLLRTSAASFHSSAFVLQDNVPKGFDEFFKEKPKDAGSGGNKSNRNNQSNNSKRDDKEDPKKKKCKFDY